MDEQPPITMDADDVKLKKATPLALESPLWRELDSFTLPAHYIPPIIKKLTEQSVNPADPALDQLASAIFQQYSVTDVTYAVFPYLRAINDRYAKTNPTLFYLAANIAAAA